MPYIDTIERRGSVQHERRRGEVVHELRSGEIRTVVSVVIVSGTDTTEDLLLENGDFLRLENGDKILLG